MKNLNGKGKNQGFKAWFSSGNLMFSLPEHAGDNFRGSIFDINGKLVYSINLPNSAGKISTPDNLINSGIYLFRISNEIRTWSQQLVIY